ncbi:hypothetical protein GCM10023310_36850 [Paenibacillus vulneris]|uniref:Helix-turn-helix type 11 domain-containing protein n=1 Tax=Paenibacillus vulneris TaxID=1133364 RepID=A0ABW3USI2_9BACL
MKTTDLITQKEFSIETNIPYATVRQRVLALEKSGVKFDLNAQGHRMISRKNNYELLLNSGKKKYALALESKEKQYLRELIIISENKIKQENENLQNYRYILSTLQ